MNTTGRWIRNDRGAVAVVVALLMIVFLGLTALAVDMGYLYTVKRQLQASADAAALAGVRELLDGSGEAAILGVAEEYALLNDDNPGDGLSMLFDEPLTEVGPNFVRVTVEKDAPLFFGRIFTAGDQNIRATAEARVAYISGMSGLIPIGLPILRATKVYAYLNDAPANGVWLTKSDATTWSGNLSVPALTAGSSRRVSLDVYNEQDFAVTFPSVSIVHALDPALPFQSVDAAPAVVVNHPGEGVEPSNVTVSVTGTGETTVKLGGVTRTGTGSYTVSMPSPATTELFRTYDLDIWIGDRATGQPDLGAGAKVNSVRSTHPLKSLLLGNRFFTPGAAGSTQVQVGFHDYEFGVLYHMKLDSDGEVGNFGPVVFDAPGANRYRTHFRDGYDGVIYIGDILDTETGNMAGPTSQALQTRLTGPTFDEWVAMGMPRDVPRLVYVPVLEQIEPIQGKSRMIVVSFAAFYLEDPVGDADVSGRFVEYVMPSDFYSDEPPETGMYLETYRLVTPATEQ